MFKEAFNSFLDFFIKTKQAFSCFLFGFLSMLAMNVAESPVLKEISYANHHSVYEFITKYGIFISVLTWICVIISIYCFYSKLRKNASRLVKIKVFIVSLIALNIAFFLVVIVPILLLFTSIFLSTKTLDITLPVIVLSIVDLIFMYVSPYFFAKSLFLSNTMWEAFKNMMAVFNLKKVFILLKDKKFFVETFKASLFSGLIFILLIVLLISFFSTIDYKIAIVGGSVFYFHDFIFWSKFLTFYFIISIVSMLFSYSMIYVPYYLYNSFLKKEK